MAELTRTYIVPLRKEWLKTPRYLRANKAARALTIFVRKHMKSEDVRLTNEVNNALWSRGIKNPPHKLHVDVKKDDKGMVRVQMHGVAFPVPREEKKEGGMMDKIKGMTGQKKETTKPVEATVVKHDKKEEVKAAPKTEAKSEHKHAEKPAAK